MRAHTQRNIYRYIHVDEIHMYIVDVAVVVPHFISMLNCNVLLHIGCPRPPFDDLIQRLVSLHGIDNAPKRKPAIISVDIPSGWHVEEGDVYGDGIKPDMLVSI